MGEPKGPSSNRQESGRSRRVGTNLFGKGQRVISDKYRKGYDAINWHSPKKPEKLGFKIVKRGSKAALRDSEGCSGCMLNDCTVCR